MSANRGALLTTIIHLWPYIWPSDRGDLKLRVLGSLVLLLAAKLATIAVPFTFKWATDALAGHGTAPIAASDWLLWAIAAPIAMTIAYGGMRILMAALTQLRDGLFAKVAMNAVRRLAYRTFVHMHELSLRFHLERKTGGLTRVLERGRNGIETIVRMVILQLSPTIVELAFIVVVLMWQFDWRYVAAIIATVVVYMTYTYHATEWRIGIRRKMNDSDTDANVKAIDSLLNYETVKYFSAEEREASAYDRAMARYEDASVRAYTSLAVLNAGQAVIFTFGLAAVMVMCAFEIRAGSKTVGDFVLINAMMIQLYQPLNFMGMVYREIKQAVTDIEIMFSILAREPEIKDAPNAPPLKVTAGTIRFENVSFAYEPTRRILKGISFEVPAGKTVAVVGPSGAGKSTISRLLFRFYDFLAGAFRSTAKTSPRSRRSRCAKRSVWCRRTRCCSMIRSATTFAMAAGKQPTLKSRRRRNWRRSILSSGSRLRATRLKSASADLSYRVARSSGWPSRARSSKAPPFWCSMRRRRRSTAIRKRKSKTRSSVFRAIAPRW